MNFTPTIKAMAIRMLPPDEIREVVAYRVDIWLGGEYSTCAGPYTWSTKRLAQEHAVDLWDHFVKADLAAQAS